MSSFDALIIALADGRTMRQAALAAGMPSAKAVREARTVGWPDMTAVRAAADEIRERHAAVLDDEGGCDDECGGCSCHVGNSAPCAHCVEDHDGIDERPTDLPGGDPVPPRKPDPVPIEPDVEAAMTAGARATDRARAPLATSAEARDAAAEQAIASVARDRDYVAATVPGFLDPVTTEGQPQPAAEATAADRLEPAAGHGLDAAVPPGELIPERTGADALLVEDTTATLQMLERIVGGRDERPLGALTVEQRQRAVALREAYDVTCGADPGPTVGDLLAMGDYIVTGTVPLLFVRGVAHPGGAS